MTRRSSSATAGRHGPASARTTGSPLQVDAIVDAQLERAPADPDTFRGTAQLTARWAAAFVLDPAGVTRTKALGSESMARKLRHGLPGGGALRAAWEFMRPMLSPALAALNRDAFVIGRASRRPVDLDGHRAPSDLEELALGEEPEVDTA